MGNNTFDVAWLNGIVEFVDGAIWVIVYCSVWTWWRGELFDVPREKDKDKTGNT